MLQAMAIQTLPQNAVQSWTNLSRVVDDIWYYAGDKSNDVGIFNGTTKTAVYHFKLGSNLTWFYYCVSR